MTDPVTAREPYAGPARDGIEAQHGLNDVYPGDPCPPGGWLATTPREPTPDASDARFEESLRERLKTQEAWKPNQFHASDIAFLFRRISEIDRLADQRVTAAQGEISRLKHALVEACDPGCGDMERARAICELLLYQRPCTGEDIENPGLILWRRDYDKLCERISSALAAVRTETIERCAQLALAYRDETDTGKYPDAGAPHRRHCVA